MERMFILDFVFYFLKCIGYDKRYGSYFVSFIGKIFLLDVVVIKFIINDFMDMLII